ncbi:MAG TPA: CheY-P-specific phosphatase CheC [Clostridiales bacterium]|jgi:chemotaxis protein CheC|nr:CheY-P-specific phosphatase CheC [Clostridiales bacterium]
MIKNYEELDDRHIDVLREIGNIGAGNAASSLATMLDERIDIGLPIVQISDFNDAIHAMGGAETMTAGVLINYSGEANGMIMFLIEIGEAKKLVSHMLKDFDNIDEMTDLKLSAIKEMGNILGSSYLGSIATLTGLDIHLSIPYVSIDMAGALMSVPIIEFGAVGDKVMFIEESFMVEETHFKSNVVMFAEIDTLALIMERLGLNQ